MLSGAIGGGISGGIVGYNNALKAAKNVWWGGSTQEEDSYFMKGCDAMGIDPNQAVPKTDDFTLKAQKAWYPNAPMDHVKKFTCVDVGTKFDGANSGAAGATRATSINGILTGNSNVYLNKNIAYQSAEYLYNAMGHELMHVSQNILLQGLSSSIISNIQFNNMCEFWAYNFRSPTGVMNSFDRQTILGFSTAYPNLYNKMSQLMNAPWTQTANFKYPF